MNNRNKLCHEVFGASFSTVYARLKKKILFALVQKAGEDICFRCKKTILTCEELSIEHKEAWAVSSNPSEKFFDLKNISFSHVVCNNRAGGNLFKIYNSRLEKDRAKRKRNHSRKMAYRKQWRQRKRVAGLPYT